MVNPKGSELYYYNQSGVSFVSTKTAEQCSNRLPPTLNKK